MFRISREVRLMREPLKFDPIRKAWRKRLARHMWAFRKARGYWPDRAIVDAAYRGMESAIYCGVMPVVEH